MASRMTEISVDCHDPERLAAFWCEVLGWVVLDREPGLVEIASAPPDDAALLEAVRSGPVVPTMFFAQVPEDKVVKNRIHFDVSPVDVSQEDEVERILALGASRAAVGQTGEESWTVLADPEGNEFCVLRSLAPGHFAL
ncbi:catechol 2,3-dioxygenase-like lactoylglutathione lyase family enzyme [Nocardioides sp. BE266]|uniref:VOC family protein n=1 Tax=Nocardioides sp. BE266 TaxID=2817725 RepID=UPI00285AF25A|nr:VOC family protein [Nocardioides sp. BE266]MDR7252613.1 catechol 2,3-dioxygenase-like lactoylglutathione lyase family enzyme [Nocardioides sp. BE266]